MTILTKPFSEKKDNLDVPLVENDAALPEKHIGGPDVEAQTHHRRIIILPGHARRVTSTTLLWLLVVALAGASVGIVGGRMIYNEYIRVLSRPSYSTARGWVSIPKPATIDSDYGTSEEDPYASMFKYAANRVFTYTKPMNLLVFFVRNGDDRWSKEADDYFQENVDIDTVNDLEKIDVPNFKNGRTGRFIHDFNTNYTGILDVTGGRCFVMPLNRDKVLPPNSLFDLVHKMWDGYYRVNTEVIRETMRVVTPPLSDTSDIGVYINSECQSMPIYKLEKFVGGVVKRSASAEDQKQFAQFAGEGVLEFNILNMDEVLDYETKNNINQPAT
ncbi:uncharacterized protein LOC109542383 isoform X1 [Dendroctonus ponderosae]